MLSDTPCEFVIGERLRALGQTLAVAESCSGGLIAHRITNVPGASAYFLGGVVAYSNDAKTRLIGVPEGLISVHGAVSESVASYLANGVRERFGADYGVGVTGIAGPTGGTPEKPVGLVYIAVADSDQVEVARCLFSGTRESIKQQTAERALAMLLEFIG